MATGGAFPLTLATNGDVALGRSDVALGLRIHKEGWTGTITGEPIWEEMSGPLQGQTPLLPLLLAGALAGTDPVAPFSKT